MYSPTTRLLTVLELLQSYKEMSGAEIARRLEINRRTVRRYIAMLQAMGIPVEAERGPYGAYQLQRGYKLPPLMFTNEEAVALTLGLLAIRLPPVQPQNEAVVLLSSAVRERQRVRVGYQSWNGDDSERDFDPYGVVLHEGYWYTAGYCHLRDDLRTFRLDRITRLELRDTSFERPVNFDALAHVLGSIATMPGDHQVKVLLKTTLEQAQRSISAEAGILEVTDEGILFRRAAYDMSWLVHYLLYLDFPVVVLEPPELRELMREIGEKALRMVSENDG
jgi:predicted DNA-binding transcriptional regulator YafY